MRPRLKRILPCDSSMVTLASISTMVGGRACWGSRWACDPDFVSCIVMFTADRISRGNGVAGLAASATAGNAAAVPALVASANPVYADAGHPPRPCWSPQAWW